MALLNFRSPLRAKGGSADIRDAAACKAWLTALGRTGSQESVAGISEYLRDGVSSSLSPLVRLQILDPLRVSIHVALREHIEQDEFRSLPLSTAEVSPVWNLMDAAGLLREADLRLIVPLSDLKSAATSEDQHHLTALHRALDLHAQLMTLCLVLRVAVPLIDWELHCQLGQRVRDLNAQDVPRPDPLHVAFSHTCREAFVTPVFMALVDPASLTRLEFQIVRAFARKYSNRVGYRIDSSAHPVVRAAARPVNNPGPTLTLGEYQVRFDSQRVYGSLEKRLEALDQGSSPAQIGFGERIALASSRALLQRMMQQWGAITVTNIDAPDQVWDKPDYKDSFALLSVPPPREKVDKSRSMYNNGAYSYRKERRDGLTSLHLALQNGRIDNLLVDAETWHMEGAAPDQYLCVRRQPTPRISTNQLVLLKPGPKDASSPLMLGYGYGLQQSVNEDAAGRIRPIMAHVVRVKLLRGLPVRVSAAAEEVEFDRAFMLVEGDNEDLYSSATSELRDRVVRDAASCSIVLPLAGYRPQRALRVVAGGAVMKLVCEELLWRGLDFDLVQFSLI